MLHKSIFSLAEMSDYERFPLISSAVAFGLVAALTAPPFVKRLSVCTGSRRGYGAIGSLYEDEDGEATEDSQAQFMRTSIVPRYLALGGVLTGCCVASYEAVITTLTVAAASHSRFDLITAWVGVGIWVSTFPRCCIPKLIGASCFLWYKLLGYSSTDNPRAGSAPQCTASYRLWLQ